MTRASGTITSAALAAGVAGGVMMLAWTGVGVYLAVHMAPVLGPNVAGTFYLAMVLGGLLLGVLSFLRSDRAWAPYGFGLGGLMVATVALWPSGLAVVLPFVAMVFGGCMGLAFGRVRGRSDRTSA